MTTPAREEPPPLEPTRLCLVTCPCMMVRAVPPVFVVGMPLPAPAPGPVAREVTSCDYKAIGRSVRSVDDSLLAHVAVVHGGVPASRTGQ